MPEYVELDVSHLIVREALISQLRLSELHSVEHYIKHDIRMPRLPRIRFELNSLIHLVFESLTLPGTFEEIKHSFSKNFDKTYEVVANHLKIKAAILEEIDALSREGVLMKGNVWTTSSNTVRNNSPVVEWNEIANYDPSYLIVTDYGKQFLKDYQTLPGDAKDYIRLLSQHEEPIDELQVYLSEGLTCLRHLLGRASILMLRSACETLLWQFIAVIESTLPKERQPDFKRRYRGANFNIEDRANVAFDELGHAKLLPNKSLDNNLQKLKYGFHAIRVSGGQAAHTNTQIDISEVRGLYSVFSSMVYPNAVILMKNLRNLPL
jgi:hypothetical protein